MEGDLTVDPLFERESELALIEQAVTRAAAGDGTALLVEAAAGLGKTALLRRAGALAQNHGTVALSARGRELEQPLSFGLARQLFEGTTRARGEAALSRPAAAAARLLTGAMRAAGPNDDVELVHSLHWLAADLAEDAPLVLLADDLHWSDRSSLSFLVYLAQRLEGLPIALVGALRPGEPAAAQDLLTRLAAASGVRHLQLAPLSPAAVAELIRDRRPDAAGEFCSASVHSTGGNPLLLRELLAALDAEGLPADADAARRTEQLAPGSLLRATLLRLEQLPAGAREVAEAVAVAGDGIGLGRVARLAGLDPDAAAAAADTLAAVEVLGVQRGLLAYLHPLLRTSVYAQIQPARRAELHRRAARLAADDGEPAEHIAAQLLEAPPDRSGWAVERLHEAARHALASGAPESAHRYLTRALEEQPAADERAALLLEAAEAEARLGDPAAVDTMRSAIELTDDPVARAEGFQALGTILFNTGRPGESAAAFDAGLDALDGSDPVLGAQLRTLQHAVASLCSPTVADAPPLDTGLLSDAPARGPQERAAVTQLALARVFSARDAGEALVLARRAVAGGAPVAHEGLSLTFAIAGSCLTWCDALVEVQEAIDRAIAECRRRGAYADVAFALFGRAWPDYWRGQVSRAAADAGAAIEAWRGGWGGQIPLARYWLAMALIELALPEQAAAVLYDAAADEETAGEGTYVSALALARGNLALARGDAEAAWEQMEIVRQAARRTTYLHNPAVLPWRSQVALAAARVGRGDESRELAAEELDLARRFGAARPIGVALRARGLIEGGDRGIELLREAAEVLAESEAALERARVNTDLGAALRRAGQRLEAREVLRDALDEAGRLGATALRERAREELLAAGARPRRERVSGVAALTPSERRVAELAAAGSSNREIAQELFIGRKTVEFHLSAVYRKLEVSSRDELAGRLGE